MMTKIELQAMGTIINQLPKLVEQLERIANALEDCKKQEKATDETRKQV